MDVFVLVEQFLKMGIEEMGLVWVHSPSGRKFESSLFEFFPTSAFNLKLPSHFLPSFFPVETSIIDQHSDCINSSIVANQGKPAICHCSEFVFVLDKSIVIELVLIEAALMIESDGVCWPKLFDGNYWLLNSFNLHVSADMSLGRSEEKAIRYVFNFSDFNVFRLGQCFPVLRMLHEQSFGEIAY